MKTTRQLVSVLADEMRHIREQAKTDVIGVPVYIDIETLRQIVWPLPDKSCNFKVYVTED